MLKMTSLLLSAILNASSVVYTNDGVRLSFDAKGRIDSLQETATGRELVRSPRPFVFVRRSGGKAELPKSFGTESGRLCYFFADKDERISFSLEPFSGGWTFAFDECAVSSVSEVAVCDLSVVCTNNLGVYANMFSDDRSAVCLRSYDLPLAMAIDRGGRMWVSAKAPFKNLRFALAAGPRGEMVRKLRDMTRVSQVPANFCGGAWALDAEANRGSYLQPKLKASAVDRWIDLAERGGFTAIHLRQWMETLGHYEPKRDLYPRGWDDFFAVAEKIRAAGLRVGVHTLTACISPRDPWTASKMNGDLLPWCSYTLAADLPADAVSLEVSEPPKTTHDTVLTYFGNGNVFRIGDELVQYGAFTKTPPYRYTGLTRGAFGTKAAFHGKGTRADYLQQRYRAFYPRPDSALAGAVAGRIAWFVNKGRFDQIYFDGSEGMMSRYGIDAMRRRIFNAIGRSITVEASCMTPHSWWHHSRAGAWDGANFDFKEFFDLHAEHTLKVRESDLLEPQMGWWLFRDQWLQRRGQFTDDIEYFAAHNAGMDSSMSFMEIDVNDAPLSLYRENAVTVLGWYERFRLARSFRKDVADAFRRPGREFRLRQDDAGTWRVHDVGFSEKTADAESGRIFGWTAESPEERELELRIEPLYANKPYLDGGAMEVFSAGKDGMNVSAAEKVSVNVAEENSRYGAALAISACNGGAPARGSWVKLARRHERNLAPGSRRGFGFWVKGDGSGAVLNVQFRMPRTYGGTTADYMFKIDFTGWRYLSSSVRERTPAEAMRWTWDRPIRGYGRYLSELNMLHFEEVNIYLNNLPDNRRVAVALTPLRMMHTFEDEFSDISVCVGDERLEVPFRLKSGQYATFGGGFWRHWSVKGDLLAAAGSKALSIRRGSLPLSLRLQTKSGSPYRARVCTFSIGDSAPALKDGISAAGCPALNYEAELSVLFAPDRGCSFVPPVKIRPGERAKVEFRLLGPVKGGRLDFGGKSFAVKDLAAGEEHVLKLPLAYSGVIPVSFAATAAECRIGAVKRYLKHSKNGD